MVNKNRQLTTKAVSRENRSQSNRSSGVTLKLVRIPCSFLHYSVLRSVSFRVVPHCSSCHFVPFLLGCIYSPEMVRLGEHTCSSIRYLLTDYVMFVLLHGKSVHRTIAMTGVCMCVCACLFIRVCSLSLCVAPSVRRPSLAHPFVHLSRH